MSFSVFRNRWCRVLLALMALLGLLAFVDLERLGAALRTADPGPLLLAAPVFFLAVQVQGWRWWLLLRAQGVPLPAFTAIRVNLLALVFDLFLPGKLGGDAYRVVALPDVPMARVAASVALLRSQSIVINLVLAPFGLAALVPAPWREGFLLLGVVGLLGLVLLARPARSTPEVPVPGPYGRSVMAFARAFWTEARAGLVALRRDPVALAATTMLTLVFGLMVAVVLFLAARTFGLAPDLILVLAAVPALNIIVLVPLTWQGRGLSEAFLVVLWGTAGIAPEVAVLTSLGAYAASMASVLAAAIAWLVFTGTSPPRAMAGT